MKTIQCADVAGKTVLLRADYNVPLAGGQISDDYRMAQSLLTLRYLLEHDCRIVIISHLGRPEGKPTPEFSLAPVAKHLQKLIGQPVMLATDFDEVDSGKNQITMLENLRFWPGEEANDVGFAEKLATLGEVFVQDGFGVVHRAHASTEAITKLLPSVAGLLLEREVTIINEAMENPKRPLIAILGGAKVSDKIELVERFIDVADHILIGGAMANTFLKFIGYPIGKSIYEKGADHEVKRILDKMHRKVWSEGEFDSIDFLHEILSLPCEDAAVAKAVDKNERRVEVSAREVRDDEYILDLGSQSIIKFCSRIPTAGTVIWNGPVGVTEFPQFAYGSNYIAKAIKESNADSIIGGGDTAAFVLEWDTGKGRRFSHISTGGGAALELMAGKILPGVAALEA